MNALPIYKDDFQRQIVRGVFRRVWRMSGFGLMGFVHTWLLSLWVLQIFVHPGYLMGFGVVYALVLGLWLGSATQLDEGEEMLFSLPPTRRQRYWVQAAIGGIPLLLLCILGVCALLLEAPQALWGLFVMSGFTEAFPIRNVHANLWPLSVGVPMFLFACVYGLSSLAVNRSGAVLALIFGCMITGAFTMGGYMLEATIWQDPRGSLTTALMLACSALILWACGRGYQQKEGHPGAAATKSGPGGKGSVIFAIVLIVFVFLIFFWSLGSRVTGSVGIREAELLSTRPIPIPTPVHTPKAGE